ncbi:hypothetical protein D3C71_1628550 [compost metagenome]
MIELRVISARCEQCGVLDDEQLARHHKRHRLGFLDHSLNGRLGQIERNNRKIAVFLRNQFLFDQGHELIHPEFFTSI